MVYQDKDMVSAEWFLFKPDTWPGLNINYKSGLQVGR